MRSAFPIRQMRSNMLFQCCLLKDTRTWHLPAITLCRQHDDYNFPHRPVPLKPCLIPQRLASSTFHFVLLSASFLRSSLVFHLFFQVLVNFNKLLINLWYGRDGRSLECFPVPTPCVELSLSLLFLFSYQLLCFQTILVGSMCLAVAGSGWRWYSFIAQVLTQ